MTRARPDDAWRRRHDRVAAATFMAIHGDRGFGEAAHRRYICPTCRGEDPGCQTCDGRGDLSLKQQATLDVWQILQESAEPALETRVA